MKHKVSAYFTVEAALVLPIVFGVTILVIYLMFFQYDRCLMEQDMGALALYGATVQAGDNEERMRQLLNRAGSIYEEKYVAWDNTEIGMKLESGKLKIERKGSLKFPFPGLAFWSSENVWGTSVRYENTLLSPTTMIRTWQKITGGE
ncbi:MAG: hypothetical protein J1E64_13140 [Acetatifactor sp.]|nr:hypothetical protein [Acetatifactor sp.]